MQARILVLLALLPILYGTASARHGEKPLHIKFNTSFYCGKYQPTTGSLKLQFGDWAPFNKWQMNRTFENRITVDETFTVSSELLQSIHDAIEAAAGRLEWPPLFRFRLVLSTPCGALSPIGKMCSYEITVEATFPPPHSEGKIWTVRPRFQKKYELLDIIRGEIDPKERDYQFARKICD